MCLNMYIITQILKRLVFIECIKLSCNEKGKKTKTK